MKTSRIIGLIISLFICISTEAASLPPEFTATYEVKKGFINIGEAARSLRKEGDYWVYISDSKTTGVIGALFSEHIIQTTKFVLVDGIIRPLTYHYDRNNGQKIVDQTYDWEKKQVTSQRGESIDIYAIPDKVQDQSIYQLSLMLDLSEKKENMIYHVAENVRLVDYSLIYKGKRTLKSRLGKLDALVVEINTKKGKTTVWAAPSLNFLPAKIDYEEDGTSFTAWLKNIEGF